MTPAGFSLGDHQQLLKERLVVSAPREVVGGDVDRADVFGKLQGTGQLGLVDRQIPVGLGQRFACRLEFIFQLRLPSSEDLFGDGLLEAHLQQLILPFLQLVDELRLGHANVLECPFRDFRDSPDGLLGPLDLSGRELHRAVVLANGVLDLLRRDVEALSTGYAANATAAKEVGVLGAVAAGGETERQASATFTAEDRAFEVVVTSVAPLARGALVVEHELDALEGLGVDERLVAPLEDFLLGLAALVDDETDVVAIAKHLLHGRVADGLDWLLADAARTESEAVHLGDELRDGVFAAGVELEGSRDKRPSLRVDAHGASTTTVRKFIQDMHVANGSLRIGPSHAGLLPETTTHLLCRLHRLELVDRRDHALVEKGSSRVSTSHWLGNRDKPSTSTADHVLGLEVIARIAGKAAEIPDDDVVDARGRVSIAAL